MNAAVLFFSNPLLWGICLSVVVMLIACCYDFFNKIRDSRHQNLPLNQEPINLPLNQAPINLVGSRGSLDSGIFV